MGARNGGLLSVHERPGSLRDGAGARFVVSLGIYLPCQVTPGDLRLACTLAYRR
jgi:hypothetical protein